MRRDFTRLFFLIGLFCAPLLSFAQDKAVINLVNPSFEDVPKCCDTPRGWMSCGEPGETAPDVQPGYFEVNKEPNEGETYIGLVVRDNETWEAISQRLTMPLEKDKCYLMTMDLARSELYLSLSRTTTQEVNYTTPARLRIYGSNTLCGKRELLAQTPVIKHPRWIQYTFSLRPKKNTYSYIVFEAYYQTPILFPYNGNILMDNASPIQEIDCDPNKKEPEEKPIAEVKPKNPPTNSRDVKPEPVTHVYSNPEPVFAGEKIREGTVINLEKIYFGADEAVIKTEVEPALQEIFDFLDDNKAVVVEIGGHTNNVPPDAYCDKLSTSRAKAVSDWLVQKGIPNSRIQHKGYGKRMPIATNKNAAGRKKNQRVEIKVLSVGG